MPSANALDNVTLGKQSSVNRQCSRRPTPQWGGLLFVKSRLSCHRQRRRAALDRLERSPGYCDVGVSSKRRRHVDRPAVNSIIHGIHERWSKPNALAGDVAPPYSTMLAANAQDGQSVYESYCSSCHGAGGTGGPKAGSIVDKSHLNLVTDQGLRTIVITGRPDFNAPDWRNNIAGHPMSDQEITDVVAWLASQRPNRTASSAASVSSSPGGAH